MSKNKTALFALLLAILATLTLIGAPLLRSALPYIVGWEDRRICVFKSQLHDYQVVFLYHGALMGQTITLIAVPNPSIKGCESVVGDVDSVDGPFDFTEACWSSDGTIFAVCTRITAAPELTNPPTFTHAYDFKTNEIIAPKKGYYYEKDPNSWSQRSQKIETLLAERGGKGTIIDDLSSNATKLSFIRHLRWKKILSKGKTNK